MTERTRYSRDPITEALLEIRIQPSIEVKNELFHQAFAVIAEQYPEQPNLVGIQSKVIVGDQMGVSANQVQLGIASFTADNKQKMEARPDGFLFSRLAPYTGWEIFLAEARRLWEIYRATVQPKAIQQVGVRYINRLDFIPGIFIGEYLQLLPAMPDSLQKGIEGFFIQTQIREDELKATILLNEASVTPPNENTVSFLLDIGVFRNVELANDEDFLWDLFEKFRGCKNRTFELLITDKTRGLLNNAASN
jgi:uncharacterized protein (TIGR04255 family)